MFYKSGQVPVWTLEHLWSADTLTRTHMLLSFSILHTCCSEARYSSCSSDILSDLSPNFFPPLLSSLLFFWHFSPLDRKRLHYWCGSRLFFFPRPPSSLSLSFRATKLSAGKSERRRRRFESRHAFNAEGSTSRARIFSIAMSCQALAGGTGRLLQHSTAGQSSRFSVTDWIFIRRRPGPYEFLHFFFLPSHLQVDLVSPIPSLPADSGLHVSSAALLCPMHVQFLFYLFLSFPPAVPINNCRPQPCPQTPH